MEESGVTTAFFDSWQSCTSSSIVMSSAFSSPMPSAVSMLSSTEAGDGCISSLGFFYYQLDQYNARRPWEGSTQASSSIQVNAPQPVRMASAIKSPRKFNIQKGYGAQGTTTSTSVPFSGIDWDLSSLGDSAVDDSNRNSDHDLPQSSVSLDKHHVRAPVALPAVPVRVPSPPNTCPVYLQFGAERVGMPLIQNLS